MNFSYLLIFLFINIFIQHYLSLRALSCNVFSRIDSITHIYYKGIAFMVTSNGYYYIIKEDDVKNKSVNQFEISGEVPFLTECCDSALVKDFDECENDVDNEHSIAFLKHSYGSSNYISLNISSLFTEDKTKIWSKPKSISTDIILSNINIDYSKRIDAIFNMDNNGELFFIQGEYYSGLEFHSSCPKQTDQIIVYERRKLSELNVSDRIDSAYYEQNIDSNPVLYLTNYNKSQYFRVEIDSYNSKNGRLIALNTTTEPIWSHPVFSRICAPHHKRYNSSHFSAEHSIIGMSLNISTVVQSNTFLILNFLFWYLTD